MKTITAFSTAAALVAALLLASLLPGCGKGGTKSPTIVAKPKPTSGKGNGGPEKTAAASGNKAPAGGTGNLVGTITYAGAAPTPGKPSAFNPNDPKTDKYCIKKSANIVDDSLLVDPKSKGVKNVIVYLVGRAPGSFPVPKEPLVFDNKDCMFHPHVLLVRAGQAITIKNSDQTSHNTHTYPLKPQNTAFNKILPQGQSRDYAYDASESLPVKVGCDIHGWMSAYHMPTSHPFVAVTDKDGKFKIDGLPAGKHKFTIWHEKAGYLAKNQEIEIKPGENTFPLKPVAAAKFASYTGPKPKKVMLSFAK